MRTLERRFTFKVGIKELLLHHLELLKLVFCCEEQKYGPGCVGSIDVNLGDLVIFKRPVSFYSGEIGVSMAKCSARLIHRR